jgi:hypothetical protein
VRRPLSPGLALRFDDGREEWDAQLSSGASDLGRARHQSKLRAQAGSISLQQQQVEGSAQDVPARRPDEKDARRLRPRYFVADGNHVIVQFKMDNLGFHLPRL